MSLTTTPWQHCRDDLLKALSPLPLNRKFKTLRRGASSPMSDTGSIVLSGREVLSSIALSNKLESNYIFGDITGYATFFVSWSYSNWMTSLFFDKPFLQLDSLSPRKEITKMHTIDIICFGSHFRQLKVKFFNYDIILQTCHHRLLYRKYPTYFLSHFLNIRK